MIDIEQVSPHARIVLSALRRTLHTPTEFFARNVFLVYALLAQQAHHGRHPVPVDLASGAAVAREEEERGESLIMEYRLPDVANTKGRGILGYPSDVGKNLVDGIFCRLRLDVGQGNEESALAGCTTKALGVEVLRTHCLQIQFLMFHNVDLL